MGWREGREAAKAGEPLHFYQGVPHASECGKQAEGGPGPPSLGIDIAGTALSPMSVDSGRSGTGVGAGGQEGEEGERGSYICQLDGNMSLDSGEEGGHEQEQEVKVEKEQDEEEDKEQEDLPVFAPIPVQLGHRLAPLPGEQRTPVRRTVQRSNKLVNALSAPRISLYNVRSAWSKWDSIAEDIIMRATDIIILTEVWQKTKNKKHQKLIKSMLEMKGIKYVSTSVFRKSPKPKKK